VDTMAVAGATKVWIGRWSVEQFEHFKASSSQDEEAFFVDVSVNGTAGTFTRSVTLSDWCQLYQVPDSSVFQPISAISP